VSSSQFSFLAVDFPDEFATAEWAERHALSDPGPAVIYARKALESGVKWMYRFDRSLPQPYEDQLNAYLNEPAFKALANGRVFTVAKKIQVAGNRAVHDAKPPTKLEAVEVLSALFQFCFWLAHTYGREAKPDPGLKFNPQLLTAAKMAAEAATLKQRQELEEQLAVQAEQAAVAKQRAAELSMTVQELEAERAALIAEVAAAKKVPNSRGRGQSKKGRPYVDETCFQPPRPNA
jgi:type I restriction enzyme R subunit